ncbi:MAG: glycosyltransferase, partial [Campylobacteraceae bacterium]|nr:glycosyltransferase [Campylobacteraceae bacterium]
VVGCRETVDQGINGFLVPPYNASALADAIKKLLDDPDLRSRMGRAGREKALKEFDVATIVDKHLEVYGLKRVR